MSDPLRPEGTPSSEPRPGGPIPEPRGDKGSRPDEPQPAGTRKPVVAPAEPADATHPAEPAVPSTGPETTDPARPEPSARASRPAGGAPPPAAKPVGPKPAGLKPAGPSAAKPAGPPGAKPAGPPGAKPVKKPARPPGAVRPTPPPRARVVDPEGDGEALGLPVLSRQDFSSGADIRWCPGCGDYAVLAAVQRALPELAERKENVVFVSGIGCSSRFPYYMNTYGFHTIHGRAPTVATGLKASRPELDVWVVTGDGDALSIGAGHTAHLLRRNLDCQVLLFNNQIYGLTKGQYSPTSETGKVTKSSPYGSVDHPFNPAALALGADGSFVARTLDRDPKHMQTVLKAAHAHRGTSFVEVYQNCNIFNDGAFFPFTERDSKPEHALFVESGKPLVYANGTKGVRLDGLRFRSVDFEADGLGPDDCLVWDETDKALSLLLSDQLFWDAALPRPFGVLYRESRPAYDRLLNEQVEAVMAKRGPGDLAALLASGDTWTIEG